MSLLSSDKGRHFTYKDLAKLIPYEEQTIRMFMCGLSKSKKLADAIATALNITKE